MNKKTLVKIRKATRNRAKLHGTASQPRLSVFRSNKYIHAQLIDDNAGKTLVSGSTKSKEAGNAAGNSKSAKNAKITQAETLGQSIAKKAVEKGIKKAIFDRGSYKYHGRVKALAEGARAGGLKI